MSRTVLKTLLNSLINPVQLYIILRNILGLKYKQYSNLTHLRESMEWLCRAQDSIGDGCSALYGFLKGWDPPYPETTGYIISTFLKYAEFVEDVSYIERAKRMGDWEIYIQLPSGAVRGGVGINDYPIVFNTGMVILGWTDLYSKTGDEKYLSASVKAADWLCSNIDEDGKWSQYTYSGIPHSYNSRVAWSLLKVYKLTNNSKYRDTARENITWVLSQAKDNGWIENMGFFVDELPFTHTIAYTLRGLLECSFFFDEEFKQRIQEIVLKAAEKILSVSENYKRNHSSGLIFLPARFNRNWSSNSKDSCLTGNAQMAIIWMKIYQLNRDRRYFDASLKVIDSLKEVQNLKTKNLDIRGGISGSFPIWGSYMQFDYPNWAAKFFADAIMLAESIKREMSHTNSDNIRIIKG